MIALQFVFSFFCTIKQKLTQAVKNRIDRVVQKINNAETSTANNQYDEKIPQPPKNVSIDAWVTDVRKRRAAIFERRNSRKQRKQDLAKRRTVAAQERMRIISQLARKEKDDDDFGMRDEDWDVYKAISKDDDSDSDVENEKLMEFDNILRHHDPTFEEPQIVPECAAENYQVKKNNLILFYHKSFILFFRSNSLKFIDYVLENKNIKKIFSDCRAVQGQSDPAHTILFDVELLIAGPYR